MTSETNLQKPSQSLLKKSLPELIKKYREVNNLTQIAFGQLFEPTVSQSSVGRWEKGEQDPDSKYLRKLVALLNLTANELLQLMEGLPAQTEDLAVELKSYTSNKKHLTVLNRGTSAWNRWRDGNPEVIPELAGARPIRQDLNRVDLSGANLRGAQLSAFSLSEAFLQGADLSEANLNKARLHRANLYRANLSGADLSGTDLSEAILCEANLSEARLDGVTLTLANLSRANLSGAIINRSSLLRANLQEANLSNADLNYVDLREAILLGANLAKARLKYCYIYGISAWGVQLEDAIQENLDICPRESTKTIFVDDLKFAFIKAHFKECQLQIASEFEQLENEPVRRLACQLGEALMSSSISVGNLRSPGTLNEKRGSNYERKNVV